MIVDWTYAVLLNPNSTTVEEEEEETAAVGLLATTTTGVADGDNAGT